MVAAVLSLAVAAAPSQDQPKWLLVRSGADPGGAGDRTLATFGWEKLARAYLKRDYRIVTADRASATAKASVAASRMVAGTPQNNALVKHLVEHYGITWRQGQLRYAGQAWPEDAGIALITDDPDGGGTLVLFAGKTEQAAFNCLSVPVDLGRNGVVVMTFQNALHRGAVRDGSKPAPFGIAPDVLRVVRLDRELFRIRREFADSVDEAALRVSRAFAGYRVIFERCLQPKVDLFEYTRKQLEQHAGLLEATERRYAGVDLGALLDGVDRRVTAALGGREGPRPIVHVVVTGRGTNAQVIGKDPLTGRVRMTLNLAMFGGVDELRLAATHEFVHTLQKGSGKTLLEQSIREGVASYVAQRLVKGTKDHEALMWTPAKLAAANKHKQAILAEFLGCRGSRDPRQNGRFLYAGTALRGVSGAPDRCGYWIGWRAVAAFCANNPDRPLGELLAVDAETVFAALVRD